jgi:hypothetical protein
MSARARRRVLSADRHPFEPPLQPHHSRQSLCRVYSSEAAAIDRLRGDRGPARRRSQPKRIMMVTLSIHSGPRLIELLRASVTYNLIQERMQPYVT